MTQKFLAIIAIFFALTTCSHATSINIIELGEGNFTTMGSPDIVISGEKGATIQAALNVIPAGGTIIISGDFNISDPLQISKNVTLKNCVIRKCRAGRYGGGIFTSGNYTGTLEMIDCEVSENSASGYEDQSYGWGGGVCIYGGNLILINCYIHNNYAYYMGGGVFISNIATARASKCVISDNVSERYPQFSDVANLSHVVSASSLNNFDVEASHSQSGCNVSGMGILILALIPILKENLIRKIFHERMFLS